MFNRFKKYALSFPVVTTLILVASSAYAAGIPAGNAVTIDDINSLIQTFSDFIIVMSGILMVLFIVVSGIMTMTAGSDSGAFKNGLLRLKHAIIGAAVILATGVILNTINTAISSLTCHVSLLGICLF